MQRRIFWRAFLAFGTLLVVSMGFAGSPVWASGGPLLPTALAQRDSFGLLPVGEITGSLRVEFRFNVAADAGVLLTPELELRPVNVPFTNPTHRGVGFVARGGAQTASVWTTQPLGYSGYHWRLRLRAGHHAGPWVAFGDNRDEVGGAGALAAADFYYLYEPLLADAPPLAGFESLTRLARLPLITPGYETRQVSSFDRTEGNHDGGSGAEGLESRLYEEDGMEVVLEVDGPGQINRIWFAESNDPGFANTRLQFFFDHAATPSYEITVVAMTSGATPPFVSPLALNPDLSSGGWVSYVPIPFRSGVKVRLIGPHVHYQITYQVFAEATGVRTFSGREDYSLAQHLWQRLGQDPKPTRGNRTTTSSGSLAPGETAVVADLEGAGVLQSLQLWLPQLDPSILGTPPLADTMRSHQDGASAFSLTPAQANVPTRLRIRRRCWPVPQTAQVAIGGEEVGVWERRDGDDRYRWCEDVFAVPQRLVTQAPLSLRIASKGSASAWQEAFYWLEQSQGLAWQVVDKIDVGEPVSERAHRYAISGQLGVELHTGTYAPDVASQPDSESLLAGLRLRIRFDGQVEPAVDGPAGAFFGSALGQANLSSLMVGMRPEDDSFYSFWPMPFASHLRIELFNGSSEPVTDYRFEAAYATTRYPLPGVASGYFHSFESLSRPTSPDRDHLLVDVAAAGRFVGMHLLVHNGSEGFIEGDERFHADAIRTPTVRGTGTEDIFNGSWYYNRGRLITALHGVNSTRSEGWVDQYRWYPGDSIPFAASLAGGIEHGGGNDIDTDYSSWAYLYLAAMPALLQTDVVELGLADVRAGHGVALSGSATPYTLTAMFEGDDDASLTASGYRLPVGSAITLTMAVDPSARQIVLRRRYDQGASSERLRVFIDGQPAPDWLDGGRNSARRWRETTYLAPPHLTQGKQQITVRLEPVSWAGSDGANLSALTALSTHRTLSVGSGYVR